MCSVDVAGRRWQRWTSPDGLCVRGEPVPRTADRTIERTMGTDPNAVAAPRLPDTLRLGRVHLTVSTLDGSIAFYQRALGLQLHDRDGRVATMGAGGEGLLVLVE